MPSISIPPVSQKVTTNILSILQPKLPAESRQYSEDPSLYVKCLSGKVTESRPEEKFCRDTFNSDLFTMMDEKFEKHALEMKKIIWDEVT